MHSGKKWWIREFVAPNIFPLNPDYEDEKKTLKSMLLNRIFVEEALWTALVETKDILNSWLITHESDDVCMPIHASASRPKLWIGWC